MAYLEFNYHNEIYHGKVVFEYSGYGLETDYDIMFVDNFGHLRITNCKKSQCRYSNINNVSPLVLNCDSLDLARTDARKYV